RGEKLRCIADCARRDGDSIDMVVSEHAADDVGLLLRCPWREVLLHGERVHRHCVSSSIEVNGALRLDGENVRRRGVLRRPEDEWTKIGGAGAGYARPPATSIPSRRVQGVSHRER